MGSDNAKFLVIDSKRAFDSELNAQEKSELNVFNIFDKEWRDGESAKRKPIVIKNVDKRMNSDLWSSEWFKKKFSGKNDIKVDLINCENGREIKSIGMSLFWSGFDKIDDLGLKDPKTNKFFNILKLKDWPPAKDFKIVLKEQYDDLMRNLPVKEYCNRDGTLNLGANVPEHFLKPDLGPKLYIAYSSVDTPKAGTTNLHIDISDAFNIIMYVGENHEIDEKKFRKMIQQTKLSPKTPQLINNVNNNFNKPKQEAKRKNEKTEYMIEYLKHSGISQDQIDRYEKGRECPGAIWHLFRPEDANKIRNFLSKKEGKITSGDLIHDQRFYIDAKMLVDLKAEFNVTPYTILQFEGDAIFIPAGSPHQVSIFDCSELNSIDHCQSELEYFFSLILTSFPYLFHITTNFWENINV